MSAEYSQQRVIALACRLVEDWTGFTLRDTMPRRIAETFSRRAEQLGYPSPTAYLDDLQEQSFDAPEPQLLVNLITNGLTAFWRDEPQLSALRSILGHLHQQRSHEPVHVWCAGVSTGEEAYTVAMIADEESIPIRVLGTDINTDFLATARRGVFSNWSLRSLSDGRRDRYLSALDAHSWQVNHSAFDQVRFAHHNLLSPAPASAASDRRWDVILCRNVLIYFSPASAALALSHMADSLSKEGYLMFGSSEQIHPERLGPQAPSLRPIRKGGGFLYRPGLETGRTIEPGQWSVEFAPDGTASIATPSIAPPSFGLEEITSDIGDNQTITTLQQTAHYHLQTGDLESALACLEACLGYDPFEVECHALMGTVLQTLGAAPEALDAFQKALFLEPHHWFAAHRTATIHHTLGEIDQARLSFRQALESLTGHADPLQKHRLLFELVGPLHELRLRTQRDAENFLRRHGLNSSPA